MRTANTPVPAGLITAFALAACGGAQESAPEAAGAPEAAEPAAPEAEPALAAEPAPDGDDTPHPVSATLIADVSRVAPGQELTLAVRFDIDQGWHIYWENPGETGLETEVTFAVPDGFRAGAVRFPGPERFESPGPITSYGYSGRALLSAAVAAPDDLAGPEIEFSAEAEWLACREACIRGSARPTLSLPVATASEPSRPTDPKLFATHLSRLPEDLGGLADAEHEWREAGKGRQELVLTVPAADKLTFFPGQDVALVGQAVTPAESGKALRLVVDAGESEAARGVLLVARHGEVRYYRVALELPAGSAGPD